MNFELSDDQQLIRQAAREFVRARYPPDEVRRLIDSDAGLADEQWRQITQLGWTGVLISADRGGLGMELLDFALIQEELGYAIAPTPLLSTVAATLLLDAAGEHSVVPGLAAGTARATVALWDEGATSSGLGSSLELQGNRLTGVKIAVPDASWADVIVVRGAHGRHFLVERDSPGVSVEPAGSLDPTRRLSTVRLDSVAVTELDCDARATARAYDAISVAIAAESVGVAQRAMEMAVAYAKEREQFGRPIGAYQGVSHRCAQMLLDVEGARALTYFGAWSFEHQPHGAALSASMAKTRAGEVGWRVPASAIQVHGGIGFTWEHDLHLLLKRGRSNAAAFGDAEWHADRVADLIEL